MALCLGSGCAVRQTEANEVGVRVSKITGVDERVYAPGGAYTFFPFINDWYTFSTKTQALEMTGPHAPKDGREPGDDVEFKTRDGNDVGVDVTVLWRIDPQKSVHILKAVAVSDAELKNKVVRPLARTLVRDALNTLSSEEVYTDKKFAAAQIAVKELNAALDAYGVVCENVTLGDHRFHENYQKAIVAKKVNDQKVNTFHSEKEAAANHWAAELEKTHGAVETNIASEQGAAKKMKLAADAYFFAKSKEAEGILAAKTNEAKAASKLNQAMSAAGGRTNVKLQIAKSLAGKKIIMVPSSGSGASIQRLDVNEFIRAQLGQEMVSKSSTPASK